MTTADRHELCRLADDLARANRLEEAIALTPVLAPKVEEVSHDL